jgi:8-hydroxy-5-deazaflavin:NADPH oxidoreductase
VTVDRMPDTGWPKASKKNTRAPEKKETRTVDETLGLIGSGMIGGTIARLAVSSGLDVVLSNSRGPETLSELVGGLGEHARAATPEEAAQAGDWVIVAIPFKAYKQLPATALAGKTVIDAMNYSPDRDGSIAALDSGSVTSSSLVQQHLAQSKVVKAFNNVDFVHLGKLARPTGAPDRSALPIAGDDSSAKQQVVGLLDILGYDAFDGGSLAESWRSEPNTPVYVQAYLGPRPENLTPEEGQKWFFQSPGVAVSLERVKELTESAVRS